MFEVDPAQITSLDSQGLVLLLRRLLHAEAQAAEVALAGVSVPLQITVPDGGEDGRITWDGGRDSTDYLPGRFNFFQFKASKIGHAGWKKECWTKSSQRKKKKIINDALLELISNKGCYVAFTTEAMTGSKVDDCVAAIGDGVAAAGHSPDRLGAIKVYDANKIAAWATQHPSVAIWLAEKTYGVTLAGYQTVEAWGQRPDFLANPYADDKSNRFIIGGTRAQDESGATNTTSAKASWVRILEHVIEPGRAARVVGTSGLGKSRFVYESLRGSSSLLARVVGNRTVFADFKRVSPNLLSVASRMADAGYRSLLLVDECPRDVAAELGVIAGRGGSKLSVITIDTDESPLQEDSGYLHVCLTYADQDLLKSIIKNRKNDMEDAAVERLSGICGGYPRFAVVSAGSPDLLSSGFETIDDVIDRILNGAGIISEEEKRALQCLCLFESLSIEATSPVELDTVAEKLGRMPGDAMYEHLVKAQKSDIVSRRGDRLTAQPFPIAQNLAMRRVAVVRPSLLLNFLHDASEILTLLFLRRCRYLDASPVIVDMAKRLLEESEYIRKSEAILTERGAYMIDALVHVIPDRVSKHLERLILPIGGAALADATEARRGLVNAAEKLVFRSRSFRIGARLLMRLGANEIEKYANSASEIFKGLFKLILSGTEVCPEERFVILDEGLASDDNSIVFLCVDAIAGMFDNHFIRFGDAGSIGSAPSIRDWSPKSKEEVDEFYRCGLDRLLAIRKSNPVMAEKCESILARSARSVLATDLYEYFGSILREISNEKGGWAEAIESVGDWLYFDSEKGEQDRRRYVRDLYDELFPKDNIGRAILYTRFWQTDIRDPDTVYNPEDLDFEYSEREARRLAGIIAMDDEEVVRAVREMTSMDLKTVYNFAEELSRRSENRVIAFRESLSIVSSTGKGASMLRGLLRGIDLIDHNLANDLLEEASSLLGDRVPLVDLYSVLPINLDRLTRVLADLKSGKIKPSECVFLSYGRGLDELPPEEVAFLLDALSDYGGDGLWAALEIAMMYRYREETPVEHARKVGALLVAPSLTEHTREQQREASIFEDLLERVRRNIGIDEVTASGLAEQVVRLAQNTGYDIYGSLVFAMRKAIAVLVGNNPLIVWERISRFFETATPFERRRLRKMIGPEVDRFDRSHHLEEGPLFGVPEEAVIAWADVSEDRVPLLLDFYPTLVLKEGGYQWHPEFERIARRYGDSNSFLRALESRMRPTSWSGSIVPLLEVYLAPLEIWGAHPTQSLRNWAKETRIHLQERIEMERELEAAHDLD